LPGMGYRDAAYSFGKNLALASAASATPTAELKPDSDCGALHGQVAQLPPVATVARMREHAATGTCGPV